MQGGDFRCDSTIAEQPGGILIFGGKYSCGYSDGAASYWIINLERVEELDGSATD